MGLGPSSSRPVAVSPPFWGWVCFGGLTGVVVHLRDAWRGFSSLGWLAGCSPGSLSFSFRAACFYAGCLSFYASFPPGEGSWFLRLAWRYGCRFWRRPFPYPWCFPDAGGTVSVSTFLGWFAILEVLVLKSRVSPFSPGLLRFSRGALSSGFPIQWPPFRGWLSSSSVRYVEFACSTGHLASCFSLFARFRPASSLVFAALG